MQLYKPGFDKATDLIEQHKINYTDTLSGVDYNDDDYLGEKQYPYGKDGQVYKTALAEIQTSCPENDIVEAATYLLKRCNDKKDVSLWKSMFNNVINLLRKDDKPNFTVFKEVDSEDYRWFGWVTNKWEDRDSDILTDAAHIEFMSFLDSHPELAPELWIWHTKGTARTHKADWWDYANGFVMYSGKLTPSEAMPYIDGKLKHQRVGMSHGFYVLKRYGKLITQYRTFEVSELPIEVAANVYTAFDVQGENKQKMFTNRKRSFLIQRLGSELTTQLEADTESAEKMLLEQGINYKELNMAYEAELENEFANRIKAHASELAKTLLDQMVADLVSQLDFSGLQEKMLLLHSGIEAQAEQVAKIQNLEEAVAWLLKTEKERLEAVTSPEQPVYQYSVKSGVTTDQVGNHYDWLANLNPMGV